MISFYTFTAVLRSLLCICVDLEITSSSYQISLIPFQSIVKFSFDSENIYENAKEVIQHIIKIKPSSSKGNYLKSISMSSTMSPGIKVDTNI